MAEFTLISALLAILFLAILQMAFVVHVRNTLIASAAEGARYAANANRTLADGAARTEALIAESLSPSLARDVTSRMIDLDGAATVEVNVVTTLPLAGLLGVDRGLSVSGHAVAEIP
ncbi:TadE/TadG family type IV pilus assembly protein [Phytoactinopolyspora halotolerans]|uniref:TadE/TadG family type IV pilus assembly protein n=1 Tax=Phytoactinopolyspora halotolerans TaxID=1981512 RepID=UPI001C207DDD|nr:TadE/TadG family type IV pilus assembly protein [Phytoactinopolyspora halotolerans]